MIPEPDYAALGAELKALYRRLYEPEFVYRRVVASAKWSSRSSRVLFVVRCGRPGCGLIVGRVFASSQGPLYVGYEEISPERDNGPEWWLVERLLDKFDNERFWWWATSLSEPCDDEDDGGDDRLGAAPVTKPVRELPLYQNPDGYTPSLASTCRRHHDHMVPLRQIKLALRRREREIVVGQPSVGHSAGVE